jgi:hypothetical protein
MAGQRIPVSLLRHILGVRPASFGFETVQISPQLGSLDWARGTMVHPRGDIHIELHREEQHLRGEICLPTGVFWLPSTSAPNINC